MYNPRQKYLTADNNAEVNPDFCSAYCDYPNCTHAHCKKQARNIEAIKKNERERWKYIEDWNRQLGERLGLIPGGFIPVSGPGQAQYEVRSLFIGNDGHSTVTLVPRPKTPGSQIEMAVRTGLWVKNLTSKYFKGAIGQKFMLTSFSVPDDEIWFDRHGMTYGEFFKGLQNKDFEIVDDGSTFQRPSNMPAPFLAKRAGLEVYEELVYDTYIEEFRKENFPAWKTAIAKILEENCHFNAQTQGVIIHGAIEKICEYFLPLASNEKKIQEAEEILRGLDNEDANGHIWWMKIVDLLKSKK